MQKSAFLLPLIGAIGSAQASVPAGVLTEITTAGTDMGTVAAAVFVVVIGLLGFRLMRRAAH